MDNPIIRPGLVPPLATYHEYFVRAETDAFCGHYASVLHPYYTETENAAATTTPAEFVQKIYAAEQEGVPTALIQWHRSAGGKGAHIALIHSVSSYPPHMGIPPSPWDDLSFASKGKVACSTVRYDNFLMISIHQIGDSVYVVTAQVIESALSENLNLDLLGPLSADNSYMEVIRIKKTIYLPTPYVGIFLERDLTPN